MIKSFLNLLYFFDFQPILLKISWKSCELLINFLFWPFILILSYKRLSYKEACKRNETGLKLNYFSYCEMFGLSNQVVKQYDFTIKGAVYFYSLVEDGRRGRALWKKEIFWERHWFHYQFFYRGGGKAMKTFEFQGRGELWTFFWFFTFFQILLHFSHLGMRWNVFDFFFLGGGW